MDPAQSTIDSSELMHLHRLMLSCDTLEQLTSLNEAMSGLKPGTAGDGEVAPFLCMAVKANDDDVQMCQRSAVAD